VNNCVYILVIINLKKKYNDFYNLIYYQKLDDYIWYSVCEEELIGKDILIPEQWNYKNIDKLI